MHTSFPVLMFELQISLTGTHFNETASFFTDLIHRPHQTCQQNIPLNIPLKYLTRCVNKKIPFSQSFDSHTSSERRVNAFQKFSRDIVVPEIHHNNKPSQQKRGKTVEKKKGKGKLEKQKFR